MARLPKQYVRIKRKFKGYSEALDKLGGAVRAAGPLDERTSHLIQLAAAASIRSEGAVHSHTRRALEAGAKPSEIYHTILLLTNTTGFPTVAAAMSWAEDVLKKK